LNLSAIHPADESAGFLARIFIKNLMSLSGPVYICQKMSKFQFSHTTFFGTFLNAVNLAVCEKGKI